MVMMVFQMILFIECYVTYFNGLAVEFASISISLGIYSKTYFFTILYAYLEYGYISYAICHVKRAIGNNVIW